MTWTKLPLQPRRHDCWRKWPNSNLTWEEGAVATTSCPPISSIWKVPSRSDTTSHKLLSANVGDCCHAHTNTLSVWLQGKLLLLSRLLSLNCVLRNNSITHLNSTVNELVTDRNYSYACGLLYGLFYLWSSR